MIAYIIGGSGFGGCVDYVTRRKLEDKLVCHLRCIAGMEVQGYMTDRVFYRLTLP